MLSPNRETDGSRRYAGGCQLFLIHLGMSGRGRVYYKRFHIGDIGKQGENLKVVNEFCRRFLSAFYFKGKNGSTALWKIFCI